MNSDIGRCPRCGKFVPTVSTECPYCGTSFGTSLPERPADLDSDGSSISVGDVSTATGIAIGHAAQAINATNAKAPVVQTQGGFTGDIITGEQITIVQRPEQKRTITNRQITPLPDYYVSRNEAEASLRELLFARHDAINIVGLYGLPGVGKTLCGRKVALDLESEFPDGTLWADLDTMTATEALTYFIEPFEPSFSRGLDNTSGRLLTQLQQSIESKRVLVVLDQVTTESQIADLIPRKCTNVTVMVISSARLTSVYESKNAVNLTEMTPEEALALFSNLWQNSFASAGLEFARQLAERLNYVPSEMSITARDIINRQIMPEDYLDELKRHTPVSGIARTKYKTGFEAAYSNLHEHGKQILPYLGVMGTSAWTLDALAAVTRLKQSFIETGLKQLLASGFVRLVSPGRFQISSSLRDFGLDKLREQGGDALVRSSQTLITQYYIQMSQQTVRRYQLEVLADYLSNEVRRKRFRKELNLSFARPAQGDYDPAKALAKISPGLSNFDLIQDVFERLVIPDPEYSDRWSSGILSLQSLSDARQQLNVALSWALDQEDWPLIRQFSTINSGGWALGVTIGDANDGNLSPAHVDGRFSLIRDLVLNSVVLESTIAASRIVNLVVSKSEFVAVDWLAVRVDQPVFGQVDMVGAKLLGSIIMDGVFSRVDMRNVDLRGSVFYNCIFDKVNFRGANLSNVEFINTVLSETDFRRTACAFVDTSDGRTLTIRGRIVPGYLDMDMIGPYE